jgi:O-antigen/teichoic acid export membrane protein
MSIVNKVKIAVNNPVYRSVAKYVFTNFFSKGVSFLLIPLFTDPKYLTPADNGVLSLFASNMILIAPLITLGMIQSSAADYFKKSKADFSTSFTSNFFMAFFMMIIAMTGLYIFREALWEKFELPTSFIFIIPALSFLIFCSEQLFALVRNRNEVNRYAVMGISKSLIEYAVSVVLVVFFFTGWTGRIWGIAISLITVNLLGVWYYFKNGFIRVKFEKHHIWDEIKFGLPIFVFQLSVFMLGATNKLFLAIFNVDKAALGIYAIACILGTMVGAIAQSVLLYVQPQLYKSISSGVASFDSVKRIFLNYIKMLTVLSLACVGVAVFAYFFLINKIYMSGMKYFFVVAFQAFLWALNYFVFLFLLYHKEKRKILKVAVISIVCSIAINTFMVKHFLIWGDALSSLINTIIFSGLVIFFAKNIIGKTLSKPANSTVAGNQGNDDFPSSL